MMYSEAGPSKIRVRKGTTHRSGMHSMRTSRTFTLLFPDMVSSLFILSPVVSSMSDLHCSMYCRSRKRMVRTRTHQRRDFLFRQTLRVRLSIVYDTTINGQTQKLINRYGGYDAPVGTWGHGVRNLLFHTPDPVTDATTGVETWIRLQDGETRARIVLDGSYGR